MFDFLNLKKTKGLDIDFDPELVMISQNGGKSASIRVSSGDELNTSKNIKVALDEMSELTMEIEGFEEYDNTAGSDGNKPQYVKGQAFLKLTKNNNSVERILLTEHCIAVYPEKVRNNRKTSFIFPDINEVKKDIEDIWNSVFSEALEDFMLADSDSYNTSSRNRKSYTKEGMSLTSKICITLIILSLFIFGYSQFNKRNHVQNNGQETIMSMYDEIDKMPNGEETLQQVESQQKSPEQEAMEEFGLEEGIKLD